MMATLARRALVGMCCLFGVMSDASANAEHVDAALEREDLGTSLQFRPNSATADALMGQLLCQCPGCQPKRITIKDCACGYAARQRGEVLDVLAAHDLASEENREAAQRAVRADQLARYGQQVLVQPSTPTVWFVPLVAMLGCLGALALVGVRWSRAGASVRVRPELPVYDDHLIERLDDELARTD